MNTILEQYESSKDVILNNYCSGCGACINTCPYRKLNKNSAVIIFECSENHGRCDMVCPAVKTDHENLQKKFFNSISPNPMGNVIKIYKSRAGTRFQPNLTEKKTVTALNCFILNSGISKKILMTKTGKDFLPEPFFAETDDEIINSGKTIHSTSPILSLLNLSGEKNYSFTGLPCQILSIAKTEVLEKKYFKPFLPDIKISLFCTWALYPQQYSDYLQTKLENNDLKACQITSGKDKKIIFEFMDNSKKQENLDEIKKLIRKSCTVCTDLTGEYSDISVGDLETDNSFNTLIVRTVKGLELVKKAVEKNYLEIFPYPKEAQLMLETASTNKKKKIFS
jgi:coenzyme F420 hydrogenase subunit beta